MAATPGEVKDLLAPGFTGLTADCGGENINKNTVDEKGQMDGGMFGELFVIPDPDNSDARQPLGFFGPCGCHGVNNADQATCLGLVHNKATTCVKFLRQGVNHKMLMPLARFIAGVCVRVCVCVCGYGITKV